MATVKLLGDDSGQMSGLAYLIASMVIGTLLCGLLWIIFTPAIYVMVTTVNVWIGQGWVSDQGHDMILYLTLIWAASCALVYIGIIVGTIIRSIVLKGLRGGV
jgi:hypothetical protein